MTTKERKAFEALRGALWEMNHMGGDDRGGYCICPCADGSAPDKKHSSGCVDARAALAKAEALERPPTPTEARRRVLENNP